MGRCRLVWRHPDRVTTRRGLLLAPRYSLMSPRHRKSAGATLGMLQRILSILSRLLRLLQLLRQLAEPRRFYSSLHRHVRPRQTRLQTRTEPNERRRQAWRGRTDRNGMLLGPAYPRSW